MGMALPSDSASVTPLPTVVEARAVVERWRSDTLATIDATVHTATPIDMEWLNGRMAALNSVLLLLEGAPEPAPPELQLAEFDGEARGVTPAIYESP